MINKVILIGRIGKEVEDGQTNNGSTYAQSSIATNKNYKDNKGEWQDKTEWHQLVAWNEIAVRMIKSISKGDLVYIEGEIQYSSGERSGVQVQYTKIKVNLFRKLSKNNHSTPMPTDADAPISKEEPLPF